MINSDKKEKMSLDRTIRENLNGKYLIIHANQLEEGIEYASQINIRQIQIRGVLGRENLELIIDFKAIEKLSENLKVISINTIDNQVVNFETVYALKNLEKIYLDKQKFKIDISRFPKLQHLGSEYWKGLEFSEANSLTSLVIIKLPDTDLKRISKLKNLEILHIYSSKIKSLKGIENCLKLKELSLARNNTLEDVQAIKELNTLEQFEIEKCKKIIDYDLIENLKNIIKVNIIV